MTLNEAIEKLNELEKSTYALNHALSILSVDGDTVAPKNSWKGRGKAMACLTELAYKQLVNPETGEMLDTILQHREETDEVTFRKAELLKENYDEYNILQRYTALPEAEHWAELRHTVSQQVAHQGERHDAPSEACHDFLDKPVEVFHFLFHLTSPPALRAARRRTSGKP